MVVVESKKVLCRGKIVSLTPAYKTMTGKNESVRPSVFFTHYGVNLLHIYEGFHKVSKKGKKK